jgi:exodeoxyribonuclease V alpha subunit
MSNANPNNLESLTGLIIKTFHSSSGFTVGKIESNNQEFSFSAKMGLLENDAVILYGRWVENPKYGKQFDASSFEYNTNPKQEDLALMLQKNKAFRGIGSVRARAIAKACGNNFEQILFEQTEIIKAVGISQDIIDRAQKAWRENRAHNIASTELVGFGLSYVKAVKLLEDHKLDIIGQIKHNPYILIDLVSGYGFKTVDAIALKMGFAFDSPARLRAGIEYVLELNENKGSCWQEIEKFFLDFGKELSLNLAQTTMDTEDGRVQVKPALRISIEQTITELEQESKIVLKTFTINGLTLSAIGSKSLWDKEQYIVQVFNTEVRKLNSQHFLDFLEQSEQNKPENYRANAKQYLACCNAFNYNINGFVGAAGTGKTHSISAIIHTALLNPTQRLSIALAAPTGKAAKRMEELTGREAKTVHRLLEYSQAYGKFMKNETNKLSDSIIIIDEFSMMPIPLVYDLLKAINFNRTRLIIVGDDNQLPPVGVGNVLRDVIAKAAIPLVVLDEVMRNAGSLKENCLSILKGELKPTTEQDCDKRKGLKRWYLLNNKDNAQQIIAALAMSFEQSFEKYGFDLLQDIQVLTPTHKGDLGTKALNIYLQKLLQKKLYGVEIEPVKEGHKPSFYIGDKVIQTRNNYDYDIMNGSQGIIKNIGKLKDLRYEINYLEDWNKDHLLTLKEDDYVMFVDFGTRVKPRVIALPKTLDMLNDLELSYVVTCHKAQGSEWPCVIVIAHSQHSFMLHRNWFYTACTRARECCIILGDNKGSKKAVYDKQVDDRLTYGQIYLTPFADRQTPPEPSSDAPKGAQGDVKKENLGREEKKGLSAETERLQVPATQGVKCSSCNYALADTTIIENGEKVNLCEGCYWDYLTDHDLDHNLVNPSAISSPISSATDTTTAIPTAIPTPVTTDTEREGREKENSLQLLKNATDSLGKIILSTNSVVLQNPNLVLDSVPIYSLQSQNLSNSLEKSTENEQKKIKTINLFADELSDNYPMWHSEII